MPIEIVMPAMEMAQDAGKLIGWLKAEGELVHKGEPLMEIETDKVTVVIEAPATGTLTRVTARANDTVPVGTVIAVLVPEHEAATSTAVLGQVQSPTQPIGMGPSGARPSDVRGNGSAPGVAAPGRIRLKPASPKARRLAAQNAVALAEIAGTGPEGAVLAGDVLAYLMDLQLRSQSGRSYPLLLQWSQGSEGATAVAEAPSDTPGQELRPAEVAEDPRRPGGPRPGVGGIGLPAVAPRPALERPPAGLSEPTVAGVDLGYQAVAPISLTISVDMTEALALLARLDETSRGGSGPSLTMTALLARLIAGTLRQHPQLNAHYIEKEARPQEAVHLGVAIWLEPGMALPVIRDVGKKTITTIQNELAALTMRARKGELAPHEIAGGTFTLCDLGRYGIAQFTTHLHPPEVALLAIGAIQEIPTGVGGAVSLRPLVQMTLLLDARAVDAATGAAFLAAVKEGLERPYRLLM
jgi:pyruvate dehydrogenase E2 component (dihydrolipoamide acetyltransferase)